MTDLYPLLMSPVFDPRPWGTLDLSPIYPNHRYVEKIGESWLTGDHCRVANGPLKGKPLAELSSLYSRRLIGSAAKEPTRFPLLTKFLFPQEKLSVQVHPDDEAARAAGLPCGKTECWYVAHAKPGSQVALGLKPGVTRKQFEQSIHEQRAEQLLHWINIFPGEMIYVRGGTVHTLGPGSIIVETQQQSDTTYRLYDYGRPRELHLQQGLAAMKETVASGKVVRPAPVAIDGGKNLKSPLIAAPNFVVDRFELKQPQHFLAPADAADCVRILVAIDGCGAVEVPGAEPVTLAKGDAVVVPACFPEFSLRPQWTLEVLQAYVPATTLPEPATRI
jgi:mannose-6-phosphate isomerase